MECRSSSSSSSSSAWGMSSLLFLAGCSAVLFVGGGPGGAGVGAQVLTPPYFNLAVNRKIEATATCGEGVSEPELFCKLTGANSDRDDVVGDYELIQGQMCDKCDPKESTKTHLPEYAVDGTERWWQSPPLSRGIDYNRVNLTISLGQQFHVAYVFIKMANSPRPGVFALERSNDDGRTWQPWQYFADTPSDCNTFFGQEGYSQSIVKDDSVICATEYSNVVPLEGGEIVISLVNNRPSSNNFSYSLPLQEWTKATNVRLRLLRTKTLLGHLMAVARQDSTVTRRYYYSIKDISIGGRCVCNGHAAICDMTDLRDPQKLVCRCQHNTCGEQCNKCCPGFVQKPWRPATLDANNTCEPCQCHGHTTECRYDADVDRNHSSVDVHGKYDGGGVCLNCQHNTAGINCEKCRFGYYRTSGMPLNSTRVCRQCSKCDLTFSTGGCEDFTGRCFCKPEYTGVNCDRCNDGYYGYPRCIPCQCNVNGTQGKVCEGTGGQCPCKPNFDGPNCDQCAYGYYNFPECKPCTCDDIGSHGQGCDVRGGQCRCRQNFGGRDCRQCANGSYNYPVCEPCSCDRAGTTPDVCDQDSGMCLCRENFRGSRCDQCGVGFYRFPRCIECGCNEIGMQVNDCDAGGQCICKRNFAGRTCDQCGQGFYKYPDCLACGCDQYGSYGVTCDQSTGQCNCQETFEGTTCNKCRPNFYNYPICEECSCNPAGAKDVPGFPLGGCGAHQSGQLCECKERVEGRICDQCKPGYWNLKINNPVGCEDCRCDSRGSLGGSKVCQGVSGQCACKPFANTQRCDTCSEGTYNLQEANTFGCQSCDCDVGGSLNQNCDKNTGQCQCKPRVNGKKCDNPISMHYFPTLYHNAHEIEDGKTPSGGPVRYAFDQRVFPEYSWKGYAIFSKIQDEVHVKVDVKKSSLYRIVFRYVNPNESPVIGEVTVTPESSGLSDSEQSSHVTFSPTRQPQHVTTSTGGILSTFVLNPGEWTVALKASDNIYVDYLVLLPQAYYEAAILQEKVNRPCSLPSTGEMCKHFVYIDVSAFPTARGESGYVRTGGTQDITQLFDDRDVLDNLGSPDMALLDTAQNSLSLDVPISQPGKYIFIILYYSRQASRLQELDVDVVTSGGRDRGAARLPGCPYSSLCRQLVVDSKTDPKVFTIDGQYATVTLTGRANLDLAIDSIVAIPVSSWSIDYIAPKLKCIRKDGIQCGAGTYIQPAQTVRVDFETSNEHRIQPNPPHVVDLSIKMIRLEQRAPTVDIQTTITNPGRHVFVTHYHQPDQTGFDVDVNVHTAGDVHKGKFRADYCPNVAGCRSVVRFKDTPEPQTLDLSDLDIRLSFNSTKPVWLDYLLIIPSVQFNAKSVLDVQDLDKSAEFIGLCGTDDFDIPTNVTGFCRRAIFSLAADYNNGAMQCKCNGEGSVSFTCAEFGGKCRCKPNVIGRTCSHCRTGYWGFPDCRVCNCPSGLCEPLTGKCICPPRVTGPNCDVCLPQTFGFDQLIGCEDCSCHPMGVLADNLDCDVDHGDCSCKTNIAGRRCDRCQTGYYSFPRCQRCTCDAKGVTKDVCDQITAQCLCKSNVEGSQCSQCKLGSFYTEERNPKGCTQCFCFGITTQCDSSTLRREQVHSMSGWGYTNLHGDVQLDTDTLDTLELNSLEEDNFIDLDEPIYWVAPEQYLGNKVTSYGGKLTYTVLFDIPSDRLTDSLVKPDVRIQGKEFTIVHTNPEQPHAGTELTVETDILETKFVHESTGSPVSREQFMITLSSVRALHIRGSYYSPVSRIMLSDVNLDIASSTGRDDVARNVEQCQCPVNYVGTSCEQCAPGYYRSKSGPYLGTCVQCQCNNRANTCDPDSGTCLNCRDNFEGPQCLACKRGYYYDSYNEVCKICTCPMAIESNNFANTCEISVFGDIRSCDCMKGYTGKSCQHCESGYWGNPMEIGSRCTPCDCNGNTNPADPNSCDSKTGKCLRCLNDAAGDRCERCRDWFYGDARQLKNCQSCVCDRRGTEHCDSDTGACLCKSNVVGATCDQCAPGSYGFDDGEGCTRCDCGVASVSEQCDEYTGQCRCRPGVTGNQCNDCQRGYWNYGPNGCQKCSCLSDGAVTCDAQTGQCICLPGVTGQNCDQCLPRWVMIPEIGCQECDNCIHMLMDDVDFLDRNVTSMRLELYNVSAGILAFLRLEEINRTVIELRPRVDRMTGSSSAVDQEQFEIIKDELNSVRRLSLDLSTKSDRIVRSADLVDTDATATKERADSVYEEIVTVIMKEAQDAVQFVKDALDSIKTDVGRSSLEVMLREAEGMLREINARDFFAANRTARQELTDALDALERARELMDQAMEQMNRTTTLSIFLEDVMSKLRELQNFSRISTDSSRGASDMNRRTLNLKLLVTDTIENVKLIRTEVQTCLDKSSELLDTARDYLEEARRAYESLEAELSRLDDAKNNLDRAVEHLSEQNVILRPLVNNATEHARKLSEQANYLERLIADTRDSADAALRASQAYQDIIDAINKALNASLEAINMAEQAVELSNGHADDARTSRERSEVLKQEAGDVVRQVEIDLNTRLITIRREVEEVSRINIRVKNQIKEIDLDVGDLPEEGYGEEARAAAGRAMEAQSRAQRAETRVTVITESLPEDQRKVKQIPLDIAEANNNVRDAQTKVKAVVDLVPEALRLLDRLSEQATRIRQLGLDLKTNISVLRSQVTVARTQANLIKVGVHYTQDTALQVRNPANILTAGSYSKLSLYFKTSQPDGLLVYIGPDSGELVDYMGVEIVEGKIVFRYNLGKGAVYITSPDSVNDNKWHEVIAERNGRTGKLTVRSNVGDTTVVTNTTAIGESPPGSNVLHLSGMTKFYVGGVPDRAPLRSILASTRFQGCIEDIEFDGIAVGLWNFVHANNVAGCFARDTLPKAVDNGYMFGGNGYVILNKDRFRPESTSLVKLSFKTFAETGLIFLIGTPNKDFMSVEIKEGQVVYQYDLGSGKALMKSTQKFNDGKWHYIVVNRLNQDGILKVDQLTVDSARSVGILKSLEIDNNVFIGGFKGQHTYPSVTQIPFAGCIKDVQLGSTMRDINDNIEANDVTPGCSDFTRIVSFTHTTRDSYIAMDSVNIDQTFEMSMKMKTVEQEGLLFYVTDQSQDQSAFSVSVVSGKIVVHLVVEGQRVSLESTGTNYNDGHWHYITVNKNGQDVTVSIDDVETLKTRSSKRRLMTSSLIYIGGVPQEYTIRVENVGSKSHFVGCIGDVSINGKLLNFASATPTNQVGAVLGSCHIEDPTESTPAFTRRITTPLPLDPGAASREKCVLPVVPGPVVNDGTTSDGIQFGLRYDSHNEYDTLPGISPSRTDFKFDFKTTGLTGTIFYVAHDKNPDFIGLYLIDGRLAAAFNCGGGTGRANTARRYNDDQWHTAHFVRDVTEATLTLDNGVEVLSFSSIGKAKTVEIVKPYYIGGLPINAANLATANIEGSIGFVGCLRNIKSNNRDLPTPSLSVGTQPCTSSVEQGSFFYADGGHIVLTDNFSVSLDLTIKVKIRPRTLSGVLFSVYNPGVGELGGDYLVLQLLNGDLIFSMDNGRGDVNTTYSPPSRNELCNGLWHTITAQKAKNVVTLEVDGINALPGFGDAGYSITNTNDPLYIGGVPTRHRGIKTRDQYVGCMRHLQLNEVHKYIGQGRAVGRVERNYCPAK